MKKIVLLAAFMFFTFTNAQSTCAVPINVVSSAILATTATISWTQPQNTDGTTPNEWQIVTLPCGAPIPTGTALGYLSATTNNNFTITGLSPETCYCTYVRAVCSATETSEWGIASCFTTGTPPPGCGGYFVDNGGINGDYPANSDQTTIICPSAPGGVVKLTFTAFDIENNMDTLKIFDGFSPTAALIGTYTGTTLPPDITATTLTGCLTAVFHSNDSVNHSGWIANITCEPAPCNDPINLSVSNETNTSATVAWPNATAYPTEVLALPYGSPAPTNATVGIESNSSYGIIDNLTPNTCYSFYAKSLCSGVWSAPVDYCLASCENNAQCQEALELIAFLDSNNNGIKDFGENNFIYGNFVYHINNSSIPIYANSNSGTVLIFDSTHNNTYDLSFELYNSYSTFFNSANSFSNITIPLGSGINTYYFPITQLQLYNDLEIQIINWISPRPGFNYTNTIRYKNKGVQPILSGTITFTKDPALTINSISQFGTTPTANGFTYDFNNLAPNEQREIVVDLNVPTIPTVALGNIITNMAVISPLDNDTFPSDNTATLSQAIVGSYDPNEKTEAHGGKIVFDNFTSNDYLTYTIQFENTGTANAEFIRVEDLLDASLDPSSIVMLNSSHDYNLKRMGNKLIWNFYTINLPPSSSSPTLSHGFVQFKIKPTPNYALGTVIPNQAAIYFDYNPPIETAVCTTAFVASLKNPNYTTSDFVIYPNPASNTVTISLNNRTEIIETICIYDLIGKRIQAIKNGSANETTINCSNLSKGIYEIELTTQSGLKEIKKLILN